MAFISVGVLLILFFVLSLVAGLILLAVRPAIGASILGLAAVVFVVLFVGIFYFRASVASQQATVQTQTMYGNGERIVFRHDGRVIEQQPYGGPYPPAVQVSPPPQQTTMHALESPSPHEGHGVDPLPSQAVQQAQSQQVGQPVKETPPVVAPASAAPAPAISAASDVATPHAEVPAAPPTPGLGVSAQPAAASQNSGAPLLPPLIAEKLPPARPAWVDTASHREGQTYQATIKSGLFVTYLECERALDKLAKKAVDEYIDQLLEDGASQVVAVDVETINRTLRKGIYHEELQASVGPMQQISALLVVDEKAKASFQDRWRQVRVERRLWRVGSASALALALLGTLFGYLRLDLKTAGACARRLQFTAAVAILLAVAGAVAANRLMPF